MRTSVVHAAITAQRQMLNQITLCYTTSSLRTLKLVIFKI